MKALKVINFKTRLQGLIANKKMETKIFTRIKSKFESEGDALASVCKKENLKPADLEANHKEKIFYWMKLNIKK